MTTAKNDVFSFLLAWIDFWWEWIKIWWGGGEEVPPYPHTPIPPVGKTLCKLCQQVFIYNEKAPCTSHTSCVKVVILLLQDLSFVCVTDIYGIYFHLSVQKYLSKEYLSLNIIKHTCSWRNIYNIGQNFLKIKHKVKWMVKFVKT